MDKIDGSHGDVEEFARWFERWALEEHKYVGVETWVMRLGHGGQADIVTWGASSHWCCTRAERPIDVFDGYWDQDCLGCMIHLQATAQSLTGSGASTFGWLNFNGSVTSLRAELVVVLARERVVELWGERVAEERERERGVGERGVASTGAPGGGGG